MRGMPGKTAPGKDIYSPVSPLFWALAPAGTHQEQVTQSLWPWHSASEICTGMNGGADLLRRQALTAFAQSQRRKVPDTLIQIGLG